MSNNTTNKFKCPICKRKCSEFYVDVYIQGIYKEHRKKLKEIKEILFKNDGTYQVDTEDITEEIKEEKEEIKDIKEK